MAQATFRKALLGACAPGYPERGVDTALGLLGIVVWIVAVIGLAAAITFAVVKLSPTKSEGADTPKA